MVISISKQKAWASLDHDNFEEEAVSPLMVADEEPALTVILPTVVSSTLSTSAVTI